MEIEWNPPTNPFLSTSEFNLRELTLARNLYIIDSDYGLWLLHVPCAQLEYFEKFNAIRFQIFSRYSLLLDSPKINFLIYCLDGANYTADLALYFE